jgi:uncharacterized protein (TIGR03083 family)
MDTWELVDAERKDNIAMLEGLAPEQWDVPSLCGEWRVRDVAAHLSTPADVDRLRFAGLLVRNGFNINKATAAEAVLRADQRQPEELIEQYRRTIGSRKHPPATKAVTVLNDMVVHGQDIRRPLGIVRQIPEERLRACLDFVKKVNFPYGGKKKAAGLQLEATDMDWTSGAGPVVRGSGEALLMLLNGRGAAVADVEGDGKATLAARF